MISIGILGSEGRMGRAIAEIAEKCGASIAGGVDEGGDIEALAAASDVLVDFSVADGLADHLAAARTEKTPIVIGTTGLDDAHHALIDEAAQDIAVLQAANTSLGVNLLAHLVRDAANRLGEEWDIEIVEMHHRHKVDAPSGTAQLLGEAAAEGRGVDLTSASERGRDGADCKREPGAIGFASLRGGSVAGDHSVVLAADGERLELGHRAESREIFARGAVKAALWLDGKAAGRYAMGDVLGL
ncbi:MAG: 4-hydroxy-tetrahydrodipicolinate reductase [Sphingomonadaceae bacterium]|nr:4-hydroxy-tetrahydrodipicolinate reductase [Sphingomonadaceae bacterium]